MIPGEYFLRAEPIEAKRGRATARIAVTNRGDRPIQVGSHCHFFEVNRALDFDRAGRLRHAAEYSGRNCRALRARRHQRGRTGGARRNANRVRHQRSGERKTEMKIDRRTYADHYGPTTGDRVRLGDTDLIIEVESDRTVYGDEVQVRRRQSDSRRHGPVSRSDARRRRSGSGDYERADSGLHRNLQGRRGDSRRADCRNRQGRKSRNHGRRHARHGDRRFHRNSCRRRPASSPPAASIRTSISFRRIRFRKPFIPA